MYFVMINSMVFGINTANLTPFPSGIHPEERTPQLWDERYLMLRCSVIKEKTPN